MGATITKSDLKFLYNDLSGKYGLAVRNLSEALDILIEILNGLPLCTCHEAFVSRSKIDPACIRCNAVDADSWKRANQFVDKFGAVDSGGLSKYARD